MDPYGFPLGCNCCHSSKDNYNEMSQRKIEKNFEILNLKLEIEEMKRTGVPQDVVNTKINELKVKTDELNNLGKNSSQEIEKLKEKLESQVAEIANIKNEIIKLEKISNQKEAKKIKTLQITQLKNEIERLKQAGVSQEEINKKLKELEDANKELEDIVIDIGENELQEYLERIERLESHFNEIKNIKNRIIELEKINNQKEAKRTKNLQISQLKNEIERLRKAGVSQEEINKKLKELEDANKELEEIVIDIGENELQEYLERIERLERELNDIKKEHHTIGTIRFHQFDREKIDPLRNTIKNIEENLNKINIAKEINPIKEKIKNMVEKLNTLNSLKNQIKKIEEKLNVFNITEGYISVNKRIVRAKDGVDGYDLVTKAYVDNQIENMCKTIEKIHIGEQN